MSPVVAVRLRILRLRQTVATTRVQRALLHSSKQLRDLSEEQVSRLNYHYHERIAIRLRNNRLIPAYRPRASFASRMSAADDGAAAPQPELRNKTQQSPLARHRESQAPREQRTGRFNGLFPLGYRDTLSQWWANVPAATAEHAVLSFVPYLQTAPTQTETGTEVRKADGKVETDESSLTKTSSQSATTSADTDPYGPRRWHSNLVKLSGKDRALNEFSVERVGETPQHNLVVVHGYGAGLGFFYKNFEALSRPAGWRLYALDMLGMGRSTRPPFKIRAKDREASIREAEAWFVDSLEEWRKIRGLERFTLLGHSLGGYMAVAYALKYPGRLDKLILASPVGVPEDPYAVSSDVPDPGQSNAAADAEVAENTRPRADGNNFMNARADNEAAASSDPNAPPPRRPLSRWITYLWDANISPFSLVRWSGPLGPRFVSGWTTRRFAHLPPEEAQALHTYAYTLFKQRGSGEYALAYILAPGAFARSPLIRRIAGVGRQHIMPDGRSLAAHDAAAADQTPLKAGSKNASRAASTTDIGAIPAEAKLENGVPVVFFYGENDWMDVAGGYDAADTMDAARDKLLQGATAEQKAKDRGEARVHIIKNAGHHVYLDGWEDFNAVMLKEMADTEKKVAERQAQL